MTSANAALVVEINRLIEHYDSLPKDVQVEIIRFIQGQLISGKYITLKKAQRKEVRGIPPIGSINLFIE